LPLVAEGLHVGGDRRGEGLLSTRARHSVTRADSGLGGWCRESLPRVTASLRRTVMK
jgi:hypothetical protein